MAAAGPVPELTVKLAPLQNTDGFSLTILHVCSCIYIRLKPCYMQLWLAACLLETAAHCTGTLDCLFQHPL